MENNPVNCNLSTSTSVSHQTTAMSLRVSRLTVIFVNSFFSWAYSILSHMIIYFLIVVATVDVTTGTSFKGVFFNLSFGFLICFVPRLIDHFRLTKQKGRNAHEESFFMHPGQWIKSWMS